MTDNVNLLASKLWPMGGTATWLRACVLAIAGSIFVALSAQVSVPMFPVPMTLQTLAVLLVGGTYGARLGAATLALYALEGAVGLPVFANFSGGFQVIAGPTGGYILGFIASAALVGYLVERGWGASGLKLCLAMLLGAALIYVPGVAWLAQFTGADKALQFGFWPFVAGDIVKAIVAGLAVPAAWSLLATKS